MSEQELESLVGSASPVNSLRSRLTTSVSNSPVAAVNPVIIALVSPLIQALLDQLSGGCLSRSRDRAIRYIREPDNVWTQRAYRKALREAERESGVSLKGDERTVLRHLTAVEVQNCSNEELNALFDETERHADFNLI